MDKFAFWCIVLCVSHVFNLIACISPHAGVNVVNVCLSAFLAISFADVDMSVSVKSGDKTYQTTTNSRKAPTLHVYRVLASP